MVARLTDLMAPQDRAPVRWLQPLMQSHQISVEVLDVANIDARSISDRVGKLIS